MTANELLQQAHAAQDWIGGLRRRLHSCPGTGFQLEDTLQLVRSALLELGLEPAPCGKAGLTALIEGGSPGPVLLLRADMDGLPIREESGLPFSSQNGNMHACGHDLHTAMLLGAAKLLTAHRHSIKGTVKLMFQPAEEIFEGAKDMIAGGVLEDPKPDRAMMIHVAAGVPLEPGTVIVCDGGISAPAADFFTLHIQGKGCHGSMPATGIDPINAAAHIITALQTITTRELASKAVLTFGSIHGGTAPNIIPDMVELTGSIRTYDEQTRQLVKNRLEQISQGVADALRAQARITYTRGCPVLRNDTDLSQEMEQKLRQLLGDGRVFTQAQLSRGGSGSGSGSEDFAYISQEVPSLMLSLAAGSPEQGHLYPQHHPKVTFDEGILPVGAAVLAWAAL